MAKVLFKNVNVLDCTGAPPFAGQVLVEGNRIKAVAPQGTPIAADGAQVVDGGGATLMPGLIESHSHLTFLDTPDLEGLGFVPPEEHTLRIDQEREEDARSGLHRLQQRGVGQGAARRRHPQRHQRRRLPGAAHAGGEPGAGHHRRARATCACGTCTARRSRSSATAPTSSARPPARWCAKAWIR